LNSCKTWGLSKNFEDLWGLPSEYLRRHARLPEKRCARQLPARQGQNGSEWLRMAQNGSDPPSRTTNYKSNRSEYKGLLWRFSDVWIFWNQRSRALNGQFDTFDQDRYRNQQGWRQQLQQQRRLVSMTRPGGPIIAFSGFVARRSMKFKDQSWCNAHNNAGIQETESCHCVFYIHLT